METRDLINIIIPIKTHWLLSHSAKFMVMAYCHSRVMSKKKHKLRKTSKFVFSYLKTIFTTFWRCLWSWKLCKFPLECPKKMKNHILSKYLGQKHSGKPMYLEVKILWLISFLRWDITLYRFIVDAAPTVVQASVPSDNNEITARSY